MENIKDKINKLTNFIYFLNALPLYEFLLSVEKKFAADPELISFNYSVSFLAETGVHSIEDYKSYFKSVCYDNFKNFDDIIKIKKTDECGMPFDYDIIKESDIEKTRLFIENKYSIKVSDFIETIENILKEFSTLQSREDRFSIYSKFFHGKMPEYKKIINQWKSGDLKNIKEEGFKYWPNIVGKSKLYENKELDLIYDYSKILQELYYINFFMENKRIAIKYPEIGDIKYILSSRSSSEDYGSIISFESSNSNIEDLNIPQEVKNYLKFEKRDITSLKDSFLLYHLNEVSNNIKVEEGSNYNDIFSMIINKKSLIKDNPLTSMFVSHFKEEIIGLDNFIEKKLLMENMDIDYGQDKKSPNKRL